MPVTGTHVLFLSSTHQAAYMWVILQNNNFDKLFNSDSRDSKKVKNSDVEVANNFSF